MLKPSTSQSSGFSGLNNDEIKRIMSVIERDFKLRQKEYKRLEELKKVIQQEYGRVEHLIGSKEFNYERCIRCYKPFRIFFNPKEICSQCKLYVCHDCATYNKQTKTWACKICLRLKELESLTADWFYREIERKYKRCGSAKVIRELYKQAKDLPKIDEDLGYVTLRKSTSPDSKDSGSVTSYVVHDKNLQSELNEYSKRMILLIDNLKSNASTQSKRKENQKDYQQQIALEISRARTALSGPLRRSNKSLNLSYENDLQNLLIQKTEEILQTNLQEFQKSLTTSNFDQKLAQIIFDKCTKKESSTSSEVPSKPQRQSSVSLTRNNSSSPTWEMKSHNDTFQKTNLSRTPAVDEEDTEKEEDKTPIESSVEDHQDNNHRFIDTDFETIKKSTERVDDWKTNFTLIESKIVPSDNEELDEYSTWL